MFLILPAHNPDPRVQPWVVAVITQWQEAEEHDTITRAALTAPARTGQHSWELRGCQSTSSHSDETIPENGAPEVQEFSIQKTPLWQKFWGCPQVAAPAASSKPKFTSPETKESNPETHFGMSW